MFDEETELVARNRSTCGKSNGGGLGDRLLLQRTRESVREEERELLEEYRVAMISRLDDEEWSSEATGTSGGFLSLDDERFGVPGLLEFGWLPCADCLGSLGMYSTTLSGPLMAMPGVRGNIAA